MSASSSALTAAWPTDDRVRLEVGSSGPTAWLRTETGWVSLHSRRNPQLEADRLVANILGDAPLSTVIVVGLALGFAIESLERRAPDTRVIALEPLPGLLRGFFLRRDWRDALASGRLTILTGPEYRGAGDAWRQIREPGQTRVLEHPVLARVATDEMAEARRIAERILFDARANDEARRQHAGPYLLNTLRNLAVIEQEGSAAALDGAFAGMPAVIAAAGPSLDRNLVELASVHDRAVLLAVDTALRPLLTAGLAPHLVVSVDPSSANARHLQDLPACTETWLAAEASLDPSVFDAFVGRTFTFKLANHAPWPWLTELGIRRPTIRTWGSVLTSAFDLALTSGCDPILFIGADLAWTADRPYCRHTTFENDWAAVTAAGHSLAEVWRGDLAARARVDERDLRGAPTETGPHLRAFRDWLVDQIGERRDRHVINATGDGLLFGAGIQQASLRDVLASSPEVARKARQVLANAHGRHPAALLLSPVERFLRESDQPTEVAVVQQWLDFSAGTISTTDIIQALQTAQRRLQGPRSPANAPTPSAPRMTVPAPERAAIVEAFLEQQPCPAWVDDTLPPLAPSMDVPDIAGARGDLLDALEAGQLGEHQLAQWEDRLARDLLRHRNRFGCPSSNWKGEPAQPAIDEFDEHELRTPQPPRSNPADARILRCLHELLLLRRSTSANLQAIAARENLFRWDALEVIAALRAWQGEKTARSDSRCEIVIERCSETQRAAIAGLLRVELPLWPLMKIATGRLTPYAEHAEPSSEVPRPTTRIVATSPLSDDRACRITLTFDRGARDPRVPVLASATGVCVPRVLTDEGLPRCYWAIGFDASSAMVTAQDRSYLVSERGIFHPLPRWPQPIANEVVWGTSGGALAWNGSSAPPYAMFKATRHAEVIVEEMPFRAYRLLQEDAGTAVWASLDGGLWRWLPGKPAERLADTPPVVGIHGVPNGVRVDGAILDPSGGVRRTLSRRAWQFTTAGARAEAVTLDAFGQCVATTQIGRWTAEAYAYADVVRFRDERGGHLEMACYYPVGVGWAGRSLVVAVGDGDVLLFEDLLDTLEDLRAARAAA